MIYSLTPFNIKIVHHSIPARKGASSSVATTIDLYPKTPPIPKRITCSLFQAHIFSRKLLIIGRT